MTLPMKDMPEIEEKGLTLDQVFANLLMYFEGRHPAHIGDDYGRVYIERARKAPVVPTGKRDITPEEISQIEESGGPDSALSKPGDGSQVLGTPRVTADSLLRDANDRLLLKCPDCDRAFSGVLKGLGELMNVRLEEPDETPQD